MSEVSQKTREYWVAKARGWAERLSGPQDDEFNAVMDDIMLSASRAEAAEARADALQADKKRIEAQLSVMSAAVCMIAGNHPDLFTGEVQSASLTIARTFAPWVKKGGEK